jgi:hypothetical protein
MNPINTVYKPALYRVEPLLNSEGVVNDIYRTAKVDFHEATGKCTPTMEYFGFCKKTAAQSMNAEGFYAAAGADISCSIAHPFNKAAREACMVSAQETKGVKNATAESEAALNLAIAQKLAQQQAPTNNTGKIVLWSSVGLLAVGAIIFAIKKMKKA